MSQGELHQVIFEGHPKLFTGSFLQCIDEAIKRGRSQSDADLLERIKSLEVNLGNTNRERADYKDSFEREYQNGVDTLEQLHQAHAALKTSLVALLEFTSGVKTIHLSKAHNAISAIKACGIGGEV